MRPIRKIIVHCSDSEWATAQVIDQWHKERGWSGIGYHFVICNGYPTYESWKNKQIDPKYLGKIEIGRPIEKIGSHAKGDNHDSIGICLIGKKKFNLSPLYVVTHSLVNSFQIPVGNVIGHYETKSGKEQGKTCPNFDMQKVREHLVFLLLHQD